VPIEAENPEAAEACRTARVQGLNRVDACVEGCSI